MSAAVHVIRRDYAAPSMPGDSAAALEAAPRATVADLPPSGRLLLWSMRLLAEHRGNWGIVQQELWLCCGLARIESVLQALEEFLAILAIDGRRPLLMKHCDARRMTASEQAVIALITAGEQGDAERLAAHARWLVRPLAQRDLAALALLLGQGFAESQISCQT
jgi:hypothetical protein